MLWWVGGQNAHCGILTSLQLRSNLMCFGVLTHQSCFPRWSLSITWLKPLGGVNVAVVVSQGILDNWGKTKYVIHHADLESRLLSGNSTGSFSSSSRWLHMSRQSHAIKKCARIVIFSLLNAKISFFSSEIVLDIVWKGHLLLWKFKVLLTKWLIQNRNHYFLPSLMQMAMQ